MEDQKNEIIKQADDKKKVKGVADIVIAVDVTGSMQPCIDGLKASLNSFVENLALGKGDNQQSLTWRARILSFRDLNCDEEPMNNSFPFVSTESELKKQIETLEAKGGGDAPESSLDALYVATIKTDWQEPPKAHRFIILFTDTDPHEELHPSTIESGEDNSINTVMQHLATERIKLYIVAPEHELYNQLGMMINKSVYMKLPKEDVHTGLESQNFDKLLESIAMTVSGISGTIEAK